MKALRADIAGIVNNHEAADDFVVIRHSRAYQPGRPWEIPRATSLFPLVTALAALHHECLVPASRRGPAPLLRDKNLLEMPVLPACAGRSLYSGMGAAGQSCWIRGPFLTSGESSRNGGRGCMTGQRKLVLARSHLQGHCN